MRWKQIRNKAEVKDDEAADNIDMDEINGSVKDEDGRNDAEATGPVESDSDSSTSQLIKPGREKSRDLGTSIPPLPWSVLSMFQIAQGIPALRSLDDDDDGGSSEVSALLGSTTNPWLFARLIKNDERTRDMTAEEYATWAECRTASFTYRKKKTFREWCRLGVIADHRAKDDIPEILGFLTSEWVQTLTEQALAVKEQETKSMECEMAWRGVGVKRRFDNTGPFSLPYGEEREDERDTKHETSPTKSPIQPRHVRRAFEILQTPPKKCTAMRNGTQLMRRKRLRIF